MNKINSFTGEYNFLSNFAPCSISYKGITYLSAEAAFQASKCADKQERLKFKTMKAGEAKKAGKEIINLRSDWETVKVDIMREIIQIKFSSHPALTEKLLGTKNAELIEGNTWHDNFWGSCECSHCNHITGDNMLGNLLMECRTELQLKNKAGRYYYGFSCLSRQDYGAEYIENITKLQGFNDEVIFGMHDKNGGCKYEAAVRWIPLDKKDMPRFEIFAEGVAVFYYLIKSSAFGKFIKSNPDFTPDDFSRFLIQAGFVDMSDKKIYGGNE
jgi:hypothetical protein